MRSFDQIDYQGPEDRLPYLDGSLRPGWTRFGGPLVGTDFGGPEWAVTDDGEVLC